MSRTFTARYDGRCQRGCGGMVLKGQNAWYDRNGRFGHVLCPSVEVTVSTGTGKNRVETTHTIEMRPQPEKLVPGVYETDRGVFVVKSNRSKTGLYAKRMVEVGEGVIRATESGDRVKAIEFVYDEGAIRHIRLSDRMPVERAKELITLYGCCIACSIPLKAAKSVEQGIGRVCIKKFGPVLTEVEVTTVDGREIVRAA